MEFEKRMRFSGKQRFHIALGGEGSICAETVGFGGDS